MKTIPASDGKTSSCLPILEQDLFSSSLPADDSCTSVELDPGRLDRIPAAVKIPIELFDETESVQTFRHFGLRKRSVAVKYAYLDADKFLDLMLDGLDHGWHLPSAF
jgi:hypothetical protein